jgi:4'-phosphopantetheinyl transferase
MLTLSNNDIHLWFVNINDIHDPAILKHYQAILSSTERERNQRFIFEKDKKRHLITRALVRSVLSEYYESIGPKDWCFTENNYGKPEISSEMLIQPLTFNLSHSDNMIVLALTREQEIGVDIESLEQSVPTHELAKHTFAPAEYQQLKALSDRDFHSRFFDFWTLKEAYIKACGLGLSIQLDSFAFSLDKAHIDISFEQSRLDQPEQWQFWQIIPNQAYKVALARKSGKEKVSTKQILMRNVIPFGSYSKVEWIVT